MILTRDKDRSPKRSQRFKTVVIPAHRITNKPTHLQLREGKHSKFFVKNSNEINKHSKWKNPWNTVNLEIKLHIGVLGKLKSFCKGKSSPIQMKKTKTTFPLNLNLIKKRQITFYRKPLYNKLNVQKRIRQKDGNCLVHNFTDITWVLTNSYTTLQTIDGVTQKVLVGQHLKERQMKHINQDVS